jgi:hypothetical protein
MPGRLVDPVVPQESGKYLGLDVHELCDVSGAQIFVVAGARVVLAPCAWSAKEYALEVVSGRGKTGRLVYPFVRLHASFRKELEILRDFMRCYKAARIRSAAEIRSTLGLGYGLAGRCEDAQQLLRELDDRSNRGEHVPACAPLAIHVGLADIPAIRSALHAVATRPSQRPVVRAVLPPFISELRRTDPEIDRTYIELFG